MFLKALAGTWTIRLIFLGLLPILIFMSSVFTVLYYLGAIQMAVKLVAKVMMPLMGTSGAETLSAAANVFMGQTEAPIIVRPYIPQMTQSELLTLMTGGLATIAGSVLAVYIGLGADPVAILTNLFGSSVIPCMEAAEVNGDGAIDIADPVYLLGYIFNGGPIPAPPFG